jgi:hypothetical protein
MQGSKRYGDRRSHCHAVWRSACSSAVSTLTTPLLRPRLQAPSELPVSRLASAFGPALAAVSGLVIGFFAYRGGWTKWVIVLGALAIVAIFIGIVGFAIVRTHPQTGVLFMESTYVVALIIAAAVGAVIFWLEIKFAPAKNAQVASNDLYSGLVGVATIFLAALAAALGIKGGLIKSAIKSRFKNDFTNRGTDAEKDASDAVGSESYGALAGGEQVSGWSWRDRRMRARQLRRAVTSGTRCK